MAKKPSTKKKAPTRTYTVYIIELSRDCTRKPCALAPLYVGQTAHDPEHRFAQHKSGGKLAAGKPHRYGKRLRWDLMKGIRPSLNAEGSGGGGEGGGRGVGEEGASGVLGISLASLAEDALFRQASLG